VTAVAQTTPEPIPTIVNCEGTIPIPRRHGPPLLSTHRRTSRSYQRSSSQTTEIARDPTRFVTDHALLNPTLVAATMVMLLLPSPKKLMLG
jgi:hypothetical protein